MKDFFKKLGSRKFLMALISVISGIMSMMNCGDSLIQFVCSLILIVVPVIAYIVTEGVLDYTSIGLALDQVIEALQKYIDSIKEVENKENNGETIIEEETSELQEGTLEVTENGISFD
jgi:hypothetical protein